MTKSPITSSKIIFLSHLDYNLFLFRLPIMQALVQKGWDVIALTPSGECSAKFADYGIRHVAYEVDRGSLNPFKEIKTIYHIYQILKKENPAVLHCFTVKPNLYGSIAGKLAHVPCIITTVTGLGSFFIEKTVKAFFIRQLILFLYRISTLFVQKMIFQNHDDQALFVRQKIVSPTKACVILGSGIDTAVWQAKLSSSPRSTLRFLMVGRLLVHKGVGEYLQMAARLKATYQDKVEFWLVGDYYKGNPYNISKILIDQAIQNKEINYLGFRTDIQEILDQIDIFVLPSYREGVPRTALEAAAMAKPIITTNTVGCKEVVLEGENGFLVPVQDVEALCAKATQFILNPSLIHTMGQKSRAIAEHTFDVKTVVRQYIEIYQTAL